MAVNSYDELKAHVNHELECVSYGLGENVAVECMTCGTVLIDFDRDFSPRTPPTSSPNDSQVNEEGVCSICARSSHTLASIDGHGYTEDPDDAPKNGYHEDDHERRCDAHLTYDNDDCTCQSPEELAATRREREIGDAVTEVPKPAEQTTEAMKRAIGLED